MRLTQLQLQNMPLNINRDSPDSVAPEAIVLSFGAVDKAVRSRPRGHGDIADDAIRAEGERGRRSMTFDVAPGGGLPAEIKRV